MKMTATIARASRARTHRTAENRSSNIHTRLRCSSLARCWLGMNASPARTDEVGEVASFSVAVSPPDDRERIEGFPRLTSSVSAVRQQPDRSIDPLY